MSSNDISHTGSNLLGGTRKVERRKPTHQVMQELSESLVKQNRELVSVMGSMSKSIERMAAESAKDSMTSERIHDRLESLTLEQRATNMLLAQLVAYHESVVVNNNQATLNNRAELIRTDTYGRVLSGE